MPAPTASCEASAADGGVPSLLRLPDIPVALRLGDSLRVTPWLQRGAAHFEAGRMSLAAQHIAVAAHAVPWGGPVWGNLGLALTDAANAAEEVERVALLCEAEAAIALGVALGEEPEAAGQEHTAAALRRAAGCAPVGGDDCAEAACAAWHGGGAAAERHVAARRALATLHTTQGGGTAAARHRRAAAQLCAPASVERVTVELRPYERQRQVLGAVSAYQAWALFRVCGVVALGGAVGVHAVERARNATLSELEASLPAIRHYRDARRQARARGGQRGASEVRHLERDGLASRDRSGSDLRYEMRLGEADQASAFIGGGGEPSGGEGEQSTDSSEGEGSSYSGLVDSELLIAASKLLLHGNAVTVDTLSAVVSLPSCPLGHWCYTILTILTTLTTLTTITTILTTLAILTRPLSHWHDDPGRTLTTPSYYIIPKRHHAAPLLHPLYPQARRPRRPARQCLAFARRRAPRPTAWPGCDRTAAQLARRRRSH